jgi:hypothetical protein
MKVNNKISNTINTMVQNPIHKLAITLLFYSNRTIIISDFTRLPASELSELNRVNIFQISCLF